MMRDEWKASKRNEVEAAAVRALERRPEIAVPEGFAARLAQSVPAKTPSRAGLRPVFGRMAGYLALAAMTMVLMVLARTHPEALEAGRGVVFAVEVLLLAQLLAVGLWLGLWGDGRE